MAMSHMKEERKGVKYNIVQKSGCLYNITKINPDYQLYSINPNSLSLNPFRLYF